MIPRRKYRSLMDILDDFATDFYDPTRTNFSFRGTLVDTDKFDIVPRKSYYEEQINSTQQNIDALEREHENAETYYKIRKDRLLEHKETLLRERDNTKNKNG
jgi:hypothetical protein